MIQLNLAIDLGKYNENHVRVKEHGYCELR